MWLLLESVLFTTCTEPVEINLCWQLIETSEEVLKMGKGQSQYYATVDLEKTRVGRTRVLEGEPKDPVWEETFRIYCAHTVSQVVISIKDAAIVGTTVVGRTKVPVIELLSGRLSSFLPSYGSFNQSSPSVYSNVTQSPMT